MSCNIHIPKPCHESWDAMTRDAQGRHCALCNKTVIDFTNWSIEDISDYLKRRDNVCGRLNSSQLITSQKEDVLQNIIQSSLSYWKKVAAVIFICFGLIGTSYAQKEHKQRTAAATQEITPNAPGYTMGAPELEEPPTHCTDTATTIDSTQIKKPEVMGKIRVVKPMPEPVRPLMGDVRIIDTADKKR